MKKRNSLGSAWGSILAMRAGVQAQEAAAKPRVVKTEQQLRQEEFDRIKAEHDNQFVTVEVESTPYERSISGQATKQIEVNRADYEKRTGITDLRNQWSKEPAEIQALAANPVGRVKFIDSMAGFPRTSQPVQMTEEEGTKIAQQAMSFIDSKHLSEADRNRLVLFVSVHIESDSTIDASNPEIFQIAYNRLQSLGCITTQATLASIQPTEQPADEMKAAIENSGASQYPLFSQWERQLLLDYGVRLTDRLRRIVCDEFVRANLSPYVHESYNEIRRRLVAREIFPPSNGQPCLTVDERMAQNIDNYNFNDPRQKAAFCHEMGRLRAQLPLPEPTEPIINDQE